MGEGQSKLRKENHFQSRDSLSSFRSAKENLISPKIDFYLKNVKELKAEIDAITHDQLTDLKYEAYHATLTNYLKEIQELEGTVRKKRAKICKEMVDDLNYCVALIKSKKEGTSVNPEEIPKALNGVESTLDHEDDEVFIVEPKEETPKPANKTTKKVSVTNSETSSIRSTNSNTSTTLRSSMMRPKAAKTKPKNLRFEEIVLEQMGDKIIRLQNDINSTIELELDMNYKEFEVAIKEYYTELELIKNPNDSEYVATRKDELCKILIKYNNKIRKYKTLRRIKAKEADPKTVQAAYDLQKKLKELNQVVDNREVTEAFLEFQEQTLDTLSEYKKQISAMNVPNAEFKALKKQIFGDVSMLLAKMDQKMVAHKKMQAIKNEERRKLVEKIEQLHDLVLEFQGSKEDETYAFLDQNLRRLWSKLNNKTDQNLIELVKESLAKLNQKAELGKDMLDGASFSKISHQQVDSFPEEHENEMDEETEIIHQIKEYEDHWDQLYSNVKNSQITMDVFMALHQIFEKMEENLEDLAQNMEAPEAVAKKLTLQEIANKDAYKFFVETRPESTTKEDTERAPDLNNIQNEDNDDSNKILTTNEENVSEPSGRRSDLINIQNDNVQKEVYNDSKHILSTKEENASGPSGRSDFNNIQKEILTTKAEIASQPSGRRSYTLSDLHTIQKEVNNVSKEMYSDEIDPVDLRKRLDHQKHQLVNLPVSRTEALESTKEKILKNIDDTYNLINDHSIFLNDVTKKTSFTEKHFYEANKLVKECEDLLGEVEEKIRNFKSIGRNEEYRAIEHDLENVYTKLNSSPTSNEKLLAKIKKLNEELPKVLVKNQSSYVHRQSVEISALRTVIEEVQELRRTMDSLDKDYLRNALNKCLDKIDAISDKNNDKAQIAKVQIKQKIYKYLQTMDEQEKKQGTGPIATTPMESIPESTTPLPIKTLGTTSMTQTEAERKLQAKKLEPNCSTTADCVHLEKSKIIDNFAVPSRINSVMFTEEQTTILENKRLQTQKHAEYVVLPMNHPDNPYHQIEEARHKLIEIKASMDRFSGNYKDPAYNELEDRIFQCNAFVGNIYDGGSKLIQTSRLQYQDYIQKLLKYFEASVSGATHYTHEPVNTLLELKSTEEKLQSLHDKVKTFSGTKEEYLFLKEEILAEKVKLEYLTVTASDELELHQELLKTVLKLMKKLKVKSNRYSDLPADMAQMNEILGMQEELGVIKEQINSFSGVKNDQNYVKLDEALIHLVIKLDQVQVDNAQLKDIKSQLITEMQKYLNLLHDKSVLPSFVKPEKEVLSTDI